MTSKNETQHWIAYKGNAKSELTEPETIVRGILKELGYGFRLQEDITLTRNVNQPIWFTVDFFIPEHFICVEVDGIHHGTARQERKTAWRDAQLIANGYKVLHIDAEWTQTKEMQAQLKPLIGIALRDLINGLGGATTRRIVA